MTEVHHRPRLLFLTQRVPFPPDKGDRIRSWQLLKRLAVRNDVWLGCLADEPWTAETEAKLRELCADVKIAPLTMGRWWRGLASLLSGEPITLGLFHSPLLQSWIEQVTARVRFDGVVTFCSNMAVYTRLSSVSELPQLVDLVDVDSEKWREYGERSAFPLSWIYRWESNCLRTVERELGARAYAVALTTNAELELYRKHAPNANSVVIGNGVDLARFQRPASSVGRDHEVVFVGAMDYRPNVEGILWFCEHVWPEVQRRVPTSTLRIVGRCPKPAVCDLGRLPGVHIHANVPDVCPYLFQAQIAVVPLQVARGVQNKVLEALASETPVLASPAALKGIALTSGQEALSAESPEEWIDSIVHLLHDHEARARLAHAGRKFVERHGQWDDCLTVLDELLANMLTRPVGTSAPPSSAAKVAAGMLANA
jgi:sugar transferase (PEP-CTERM/EpsH1 system associated)